MKIKYSRNTMISVATAFVILNFSNRKILAANYDQLVLNQRNPLVSLLVLNDFYHLTNLTARKSARYATYFHVGTASEEQVSFQSSNRNISRYWIPFTRNYYRFVTCSR